MTNNYRSKADKRMSLKEAISTFVHDGCSITFGGLGGAQSIAKRMKLSAKRKRSYPDMRQSLRTCRHAVGSWCLQAP
jgi:hypothetical protein